MKFKLKEDVDVGFTNKLLNVALETYPLVDELPSGGLVAKILTPPPRILVTAKVPKTIPNESIIELQSHLNYLLNLIQDLKLL